MFERQRVSKAKREASYKGVARPLNNGLIWENSHFTAFSAMNTTSIVVSSLVLTAIIFWWLRRHPRINSFWDVVRNPGSLPDLDEYDRKIKEAARDIRSSPEAIAKLVDYFVFKAESTRDAWSEMRVIRELGAAAHPPAIAILADPSARDKLTTLKASGPESCLKEGPINRLCEVLQNGAKTPDAAASLLAPFFSPQNDKEINKSVIGVIASLGGLEHLPLIQQALRDENAYVQSRALSGIQSSLKAGKIPQNERSAFFDAVADMWPADTVFFVSREIADNLVSLDRDRAVHLLTGKSYFHIGFKPLWSILEVFGKENVVVPRPLLLRLLNDLCATALDYPLDNMLRETLASLGSHRDPEDLQTLHQWLQHENEKAVEGAVQGLYRFHRHEETIRDPWEAEKSLGWHGLTTAEKPLRAIDELDCEVRNGGFAQYYFNSSAEHWREALAGLEAIAAVRHLELFRQTLAFFPDASPPIDRDERSDQLAKVARKKHDPFHDQDRAWSKLKEENLGKLKLLYDLTHLEGREK